MSSWKGVDSIMKVKNTNFSNITKKTASHYDAVIFIQNIFCVINFNSIGVKLEINKKEEY